jgi:hypothetical protein
MIMKPGTEFELFVKAIYEEVLTLEGFNTVKVEHNISLFGQSGRQAHQIDVYWEFKLAGVTHKVAIECKEYKNNVPMEKSKYFMPL